MDYYYYFDVTPITNDQIKQLEEYHNSKSLERFDLKQKNPTVQSEQCSHDGISPTVQNEQFKMNSSEVNSSKRTDNIIHNQHNTHEHNTHEHNTHNNKKESGSSYNELINKVKIELGVNITPAYKNELLKIFSNFDDDIINYAIEYASINGSSPKQFLLKVLSNWQNANITTLEQAKNFKISSKKNNIVHFSKEKTPKWLQDRNNNNSQEMTEEEKAKFEEERKAFLQQLQKDWEE